MISNLTDVRIVRKEDQESNKKKESERERASPELSISGSKVMNWWYCTHDSLTQNNRKA